MATIKTSSGRKRAQKKSAPKQKVRIIYREKECDKEHGSGGEFKYSIMYDQYVGNGYIYKVENCEGGPLVNLLRVPDLGDNSNMKMIVTLKSGEKYEYIGEIIADSSSSVIKWTCENNTTIKYTTFLGARSEPASGSRTLQFEDPVGGMYDKDKPVAFDFVLNN